MDGKVGSEDEFHETLEDITSASSSEAEESIRTQVTKVAPATGHDRPPVWTPSVFPSKFSVWKDDPSSINERRQRFFKHLGIKNLREEPTFGLAASVLSRGKFPASPEKAAKQAVEAAKDVPAATSAEKIVNPACQICEGSNGDLANSCKHLDGSGVIGGERTEPGGIADYNTPESDLENGVKSGQLEQRGVPAIGNRLVETSGAVLREGRSKSGPVFSDTTGSKATQKATTRSGPLKASVDGDGAHDMHRSSGISLDVIPNQAVSNRSLASPEGSLSPLWNGHSHVEVGYRHQASSSLEKLSQSYDTDNGYDTRSQDGHSAVEESGRDEVLKIRDLDSGKEFVMNVLNRDGTLDILRDVDTGKELTMAEFDKVVGLSPITQELRRRAAVSRVSNEKPGLEASTSVASSTKKKSWLKNLGIRRSKEKPISGGSGRSDKHSQSGEETDGSSRGAKLSRDGSSKGGNSREGSFAGPDREDSAKGGVPTDEHTGPTWTEPQKVKVKLHRKSMKELSDLHMVQEIQAHQGAIWTMKFSPDGRYLASAGQDRVVNIWEVLDHPSLAESDLWGGHEAGISGTGHQGTGRFDKDSSFKGAQDVCAPGDKDGSTGGGKEGSTKGDKDGSARGGKEGSTKGDKDGSTRGGKEGSTKGDKDGSTRGARANKEWGVRGGRTTLHTRKSGNLDLKGPVPKLFWLSEKPICSFWGHTGDILDVSWSETQFLLSSSMDKTVRLWHISYEECLRVFSHNDYVTCVQFNPVDDHYFLSGALDDKVRIWSITEHQVVDWSDLREMVTAVCYTPDGEKAVVGSYKGICRFYCTTGNKLQLDASLDIRTENKKGRGKKITGLHCMPGDSQKVLVTSNDSRIRVYDDLELSAKYKGLKNINSQISASYTRNGEYIISASEDSRVFLWSSGNRDTSTTRSLYRRDKQFCCEEFNCRYVSVAIPWPEPPVPSNISQPGSETLCGSDRISIARVASETDVPSPGDSDAVGMEESNEIFKLSQTVFDYNTEDKLAVNEEPILINQVDMKLDVNFENQGSLLGDCEDSPPYLQSCTSFFSDSGSKGSMTWPEEKLPAFGSPMPSGQGLMHSASVESDEARHAVEDTSPAGDTPPVSAAWGLVIVTAGLGGEIRTFQNYGLPVRL